MGTTNERAAETAPGTQRSAKRPLFEPPRLRTYDKGDRETTWLELFFDLVFVVVVDQVSQRLRGPITTTTVGGFTVLAVLVWWAWVGYVYYVDRFGTDDLRDRLITLVQMGAATAIAVRAHDALGKGAASFAIAALAIINLAYAASGVAQCNRVQSLWMLLTAAAALGVAALGGQLSTLAVFGIIALVSVAQIGVDLWYSARAADSGGEGNGASDDEKQVARA